MKLKEDFLSLIRLGIGHYSGWITDQIDWHAIKALAENQGLSAVVLDGIEHLPENRRPPQVMLLEWIGEVLQGYEFRYEQYCKAISELAGFYNSHGYKMMVLKGNACAMNWPKPEHRPCGDIDIWLFGKQKEAAELLAKEKNIKIDSSHHHHTVFSWSDFSVENHYDFVNVHSRKSNAKIEKIFKELGKDESNSVTIYNEKVYIPSPDLHALFLLKHALGNFVSTSITLRQVLDWAFFFKAHGDKVNKEWLINILEKYQMREFFNIINAICVENLGFNNNCFPFIQFKPFLKDKVLDDILNPQYDAVEQKQFLPRLYLKYRRWKGNAWKREMCIEESNWIVFWNGVWSHLLKPASI